MVFFYNSPNRPRQWVRVQSERPARRLAQCPGERGVWLRPGVPLLIV